MFAPAPPLLEAWKTAVTAGSGAPTALLLEPDSKTGSVACAATFAEGSDDPAAPWGFIASHAEKGAAPLLFLINEGASKWRFVSFVPEGTHPAKKMAYANARSSLRPLLGKDAVDFQPDYHVTDKEELTLGAMREWADRSDREAAMSTWEKEKAAVIRNEDAERGSAVRAAGAVVAVHFDMSEELTTAVKAFEAGCHAPAAAAAASSPASEGSTEGEEGAGEAPATEAPAAAAAPAAADPDALSFIAVRVSAAGSEALELVEKASLCAEGEGATRGVAATCDRVKAVLGAAEEPRFFLLRVGESAAPGVAPVLLYVCPEGIAPRLKMRASTAKAALVSSCASAAGLRFGRSLEASSLEEALEQVTEAAGTKVAYPLPGSSASAASGSSGGLPLAMGHALASPSGSSGSGGAHHAAGSPPVGAFRLPGMGGGMPMGGIGLIRSPDKGSHAATGSGDAGVDTEMARPVAPWRANLKPTGMPLPGISPK